MYVPSHFAESSVERLVELVRGVGFGHLVVAAPEGLTSTPLPIVIDDDASVVRAHLARPNGIWKLAPCVALVIVPVSDAYVSPSWYPSKTEHGKVVPTWNYEVVHLHGRLVAHDDARWVGGFVRELTDIHESRSAQPWSVDDAPADFIAAMTRGIVGIELEVSRVEGKRKLSQNRDVPDRVGVVDGLRRRRPARSVSDAMLE